MPGPIPSNNTGDTLSTRDPGSVRALWQRGCMMAEQTADFFAAFEGKSKNSLILTKTDTSKGKGQQITFTNKSGFYSRGKQGDEQFTQTSDFEPIHTNSYKLTVDFLRHASQLTRRAEEKMGMRGEIKAGIPVEQGKWLGRQKSHRLFMMFREKLNSDNRVYANRKTLDTLGSNDTLSYDNIVIMGGLYEPMGGRPAIIGKDGKNIMRSNVVVSPVNALLSLKLDQGYKDVLKTAGERGPSNPLFKGTYTKVDGHCIAEYNPIDHDGVGPIGSPMNPKGELGVAIPAAFGNGDSIKGGGYLAASAEDVDFFQDFPNFNYRFIVGDTLSKDAKEHYVLIVNPPNAAVDPGKVGMYAYTTGNNGTEIVITKALGTSGGRVATIGAVGFNAGDWSGYHTEVHPEGATVIPCNRKGVPIGWTYMLGANCAMRGHGIFNRKRDTDTTDGGHIHQSFITSVFGQELRQDRRGRHIGAITLCHAVTYPEMNLPTIA